MLANFVWNAPWSKASPWTVEREELLKTLLEAKRSCNWLAREINRQSGSSFTRNAIIGKLHRMGISKPQPDKQEKRTRSKKPREPRFRPERKVIDLFADLLPPADFLGIQFVETNRSTCMYPEGDGSHMLFCGQPRRAESSYCAAHHKICYWKPDRPVRVGRAA